MAKRRSRISKAELAAATQSVGQVVKAWRIYRELTQDELARKAAISTQYVYRIERGIAMPSLRAMVGISVALRIDLAIAYSGVEAESQPVLPPGHKDPALMVH